MRKPFDRVERALATLFIAAMMAPSSLAQGTERGIYGQPVELKKREESLIETVHGYKNMFYRRGLLHNQPEVNDLLERIGKHLAPEPTDPYIEYRFLLFHSPAPNAFALPDGQIYVNTGMLALLENEAQIAGLLAHEINHTAGHHTLVSHRSVRRKIITSMVLGPLTLGIADIFLVLAMFGYSRDLEEEADRHGIRMMFDGGYDVREMKRVFEILYEDPEGERYDVKTKWSTHPQLMERAEYLSRTAREMTKDVDVDGLKVGRKSYRAAVRGVSLMTVDDLVRADYPRSALALARRLIEEDGTDARAHYLMGEAWRSMGGRSELVEGVEPTKKEKKKAIRKRIGLTREEREERRLETGEGRENLEKNLENASAAYRNALSKGENLVEAHRGLGFALEGLKDDKGAAKAFMKYIRARPDASDKQIVLEHLKSITDRLKQGE